MICATLAPCCDNTGAIDSLGHTPEALGLTLGNHPQHPLYMRADLTPFTYEAR